MAQEFAVSPPLVPLTTTFGAIIRLLDDKVLPLTKLDKWSNFLGWPSYGTNDL